MNELTINLKTKSDMPLYEQIYRHIKTEIQSGRIACREKLPSTRALSRHLEVSRSTVELAYEQLLSEGYIESEPCKGFFAAQLEGLYQFADVYKRQEWNRGLNFVSRVFRGEVFYCIGNWALCNNCDIEDL